MRKLTTAIICFVALVLIAWAIVAAYQHHKRISWRPPRVRLTPQLEALRKQFHAAIADGRGITNGVIHPKEDDYLKQGADPAELKKGRQIGEAIVNGDFASLAKLNKMEKVAAEKFHAERTNWNHEQYNELAGPEQMKLFAPASFAEDIVISAGLRNYKNGLKAMDIAFEVPGARGIPMAFLNTLARRGNEAALEVFLNATNYGLPLSETIFPLKNAADNGNQEAIDKLVAIFANTRNNPLWYITMDALAKATAAGNETAIDALITLSTNKIPGIGPTAIRHLQLAADNNNAKAIEALKQLDPQGLMEPGAKKGSENLRQQMAQVIAEAIANTNAVDQRDFNSNAGEDTGNPELEKAIRLGEAIVNGDATAMKQLIELSKSEYANFNAKSAGLEENASADLATKTFAPLGAAFKVLNTAALNGDTNALEGIAQAIHLPELQGNAVLSLAVLAHNGNVAAAEILINPKKYGLWENAGVGLLEDTANGLRKAAESGNSAAVNALIVLSANKDIGAREAAIEGLKEAATNHNATAAAALEKLNTK